MVDSSQLTFLPTSKSRDTKLGQISKIRPDQIEIHVLCPSLRMIGQLPAPTVLMAEEIAFKNGRISNFQELVTLALTLDLVILHTVVHHSSTSTCMPNFIEIEETYCGRTDGRTDRRTFATHFIRSTQTSRHKKLKPGLVASYDIRPGNRDGLFWFRRFINFHILTYLLT